MYFVDIFCYMSYEVVCFVMFIKGGGQVFVLCKNFFMYIVFNQV